MTIMGLDYLKHKETQRSNLANERETHRSNLANETERNRSNLANEAETHRSNLAREAETNRSNLVKEFETHRNNVVNETLKSKEVQAKIDDIAEKIRHNQKAENLESYKTTLNALPKEIQNVLGAAVAYEDPTLGRAYDLLLSTKDDAVQQAKEALGPRLKQAEQQFQNFTVDVLDYLKNNTVKAPVVGGKWQSQNFGTKSKFKFN